MADYVKLKDESDEGSSSRSSRQPRRRFRFGIGTFILIFLGFLIVSSIISSAIYSVTPKVAVVPISGPLMTQESATLFGYAQSSRSISNTIRELANDNSVRAIVLDINSGGGSPVASEEISRAIEFARESKPVYALINDVGASGAFWIAVSADKVFASSMSTTGSIGVTSAGLTFENFIEDYNITYRRLVSGEQKDMGSIFRELTTEEEFKIQGILDEVHELFISHVASSRNLSFDYVSEYATGEIFLGSTALNAGFIDEIGYYPDVMEYVIQEHGDLMEVRFGPRVTVFDLLGVSTFLSQIYPLSQPSILLVN